MVLQSSVQGSLMNPRAFASILFVLPLTSLPGAQSAAAQAGPASAPVLGVAPRLDQPILTVRKGSDPARVLTLNDLETMPRVSFSTTTPWHDGAQTFEGVPLKTLFERFGFVSGDVKVSALDGYVARIPVEEASRFQVILAYKRGGAYMPVREKGPLFIIYNYDARRSEMSEPQYSRSVWQVRAMQGE